MYMKQTLLSLLLMVLGIGAANAQRMDERFSEDKLPYGWFTEGWSVKDKAAQSSNGGMGGMMGDSKSGYLLTPPLNVVASDSLAFSVKKGGMSFGGSDSLVVEKSVYGSGQWEQVAVLKDTLSSSYSPFAIKDIADGEYRFRFLTSSTIYLDSVAGHTIDNEAPDLYVTLDSAVVNDVYYGNLKKDSTATFIVMNTGTGTLNVNVSSTNDKYFSVSPSSLSIAAGDSATLDVTYHYLLEEYGQRNDTITFEPTDGRLTAQKVSFRAIVPDPDIWYEDFNENDTIPFGMFAEEWEVKKGVAQKKSGSGGLFGGGSANYLLTPPLVVEEGMDLVFSAKKGSSGMGTGIPGMASDSTFVVERSLYSQNKWVRVADLTKEIGSEYKTFTISGTEPGEYRFRFKAEAEVQIDSIVGFRFDNEAPDIYVVENDAFAKDVDLGVCNADSTRTFTVINTGTSTLNVNVISDNQGDEQVFTVNPQQIEVAVGDSVAVDITFNYQVAHVGKNESEIVFEPTDGRVYSRIYRFVAVRGEEGVWSENFNDCVQPKGWFTEGWEFRDSVATTTGGSGGLGGMMGGGEIKYLVTPPLIVGQDVNESLVFTIKKPKSDDDSGMGGGSFGMGGSSSVVLERSVYGSNKWEKVKEYTDEIGEEFKDLWASYIPQGEYRFRFAVSDSIVIDSIAGFHLDENAPDLYVTYKGKQVSDVNFGMPQCNNVKTFSIINTGTGTLQVALAVTDENLFSLSQNNVSVESGDTVTVDVTFLFDPESLGEHKGAITFTPAGDVLQPQTVSLRAYTTYADAWSEDFEPEFIPEDESAPINLPFGWETTGWEVRKPSSDGNLIEMIMSMMGGSGSSEETNNSWMAKTGSEDYELITPELQAVQGDVLRFHADMSGGGGLMDMLSMFMGGGESTPTGLLNVYYATGNNNDWKFYGAYTKSDSIFFVAPYSGVYQLRFTGKNVSLDNFLGFHQPTGAVALSEGLDDTNQAVLETYNGMTVNVSYDRELSAQDNGDGTWTPRAYTISLPYDYKFSDYYELGKVKLYQLTFIDNYYKQFIFITKADAVKAGRAYLAVVEFGSVRLDAHNVTLTSTPYAAQENDSTTLVYDFEDWWFNDKKTRVGEWLGTFRTITDEEADELNMYCLRQDGTWGRLKKAEGEGAESAKLDAFRGYFLADEAIEESGSAHQSAPALRAPKSSGYRTMFQNAGVSSVTEPETTDATATIAFEGDIPIIEETDVTAVEPTFRVVDEDGTSRCFDLQGRLIKDKPAKGVYINKGKKVVVK